MPEILTKEKSQVPLNHGLDTEQFKVPEDRHPAFKSKIELLLEQTGFRRRKALLGLDIGSSGIKMAEVNKTKKGWRLVNAGIVEFDSSSKEFSKANPSGRLAIEIKNALREYKITTSRAALSISGDDLIQRLITLPQMPAKELRRVLTWEVKKYSDFPSEEFYIDYLIKPKLDQSEDNLYVFLVAYPKRKAEEQISLIHSTGLKCAVLETKATALTGGILELAPEFGQKTFAILDIGSKSSVLNIVIGGFLNFTREIEWGGENLTLTLCNKLKYDRQKAETQKKEVGLLTGARGKGLDSTSEWLTVAKILEEEMDTLVLEITKSLEYHLAQFPQEEVKDLLLTGGGSGLPGLEKFFTQRLVMNAQLFDPLDSLLPVESPETRRYLQSICGRLCVALGLGTRRRG
jgi:type IV pilus assembly protein PilM